MSRVIRVKNINDAKLAEKFIFEMIKPGAKENKGIPIPSLKDKLAWLSWANLRRAEQPSFIFKQEEEIIAGIFGEPVEQWFDKGEAKIQELLFKDRYENEELAIKLLKAIVEFYKKENAKQAHFWMLEEDFNKNKYPRWQSIAIDSFGFGFKGFRHVSKWRNKPIVKIEKYF